MEGERGKNMIENGGGGLDRARHRIQAEVTREMAEAAEVAGNSTLLCRQKRGPEHSFQHSH